MATLTLRDLTVTTINALGTVPTGIATIAEGLGSYASEWQKDREVQVFENQLRRDARVVALTNKAKESGLTEENVNDAYAYMRKSMSRK